MHLLVILIICLLIFGPKKLGELGKGLGEGIRNFKSSMGGNDANGKPNATNSTTTTTSSTTPPPEEKK
ncbi:MAG: twin-arginine translocase TatA/TatE family subunit [Candidatus Korobacteraceae bacterium]